MSLITQLPTRTGQKAVWWQRTGQDETGAPSFAAPAEISVRWDAIGVEFIDSKGEKQLSQAVIYPDRVLAAGDYLWLGELVDLPTAAPLGDVEGGLTYQDALDGAGSGETGEAYPGGDALDVEGGESYSDLPANWSLLDGMIRIRQFTHMPNMRGSAYLKIAYA